MKKNLLFLMLALVMSITAFAQYWEPVQQNTNLSQNRGIQTISVIDSNVVWANSYDGSGSGGISHDYIRTIDGGVNWVTNTVPASAGWEFSHFVGFSDTMAWAVFYNATVTGAEVYYTIDAGLSWQSSNPFTANSFGNVVHFFNDQDGFLMGDPESGYFEIYTTANQGATWTRVPSANIPLPLAGEYGTVRSVGHSGNSIWFGTNKSRIFRSTNKGLTWAVTNLSTLVGANATITEFAMESPTTGMCFAAGSDTVNRIIKTTDGGVTWTQVVSNFQNAGFIKWRNGLSYVPGSSPSRYFVTGARYTTGDHGSVYTEDYGTTWTTVDSAVQHIGTGWSDINHGWSGGFTGVGGVGGMFVWHPSPASANFTVSLSSSPVAGGTTSGGGSYSSGSSVTVTATPNTGYIFVNWTENGVIVSTSSSYTFNLLGNRNLVANFVQSTTSFTVTLSSSPVAGGTTTGAGTYTSGANVTVTATPNTGYVFVNWTENGVIVSTSSSYTFSILANRNLVANFAQTTTNYTVTLSSSPVAGGTTTGAGTYTSGVAVLVSATANTGYTFVNWTENGVIVSNNTTYGFNISANRNLVANFTQNTSNYTVIVSANPVAGGTATGGGSYASGTSVTVSATANTGYSFSNWTENGSIISTSLNYTFNIAGNRTLVANFIQNYTVILSANPVAGGNVTGAGTYMSGFAVTVNAAPNTNYTFDNWTENGVIVSTNSSYSFSISANRTLVANFSPVIAIEPNVLASLVSLYPNPSQGSISIKSSEDLELKIYNPLGQLVVQKAIAMGENHFELAENGLYVFIFTKEGEKPYILKQMNHK